MDTLDDQESLSTRLAGDDGDERGLRRWLAGWPRWLPVAAAVVLGAYAILGAIGLVGGPYLFAPATNPENLFGDHWLSRLPARNVEIATVLLSTAGVLVVLLQCRGVRGPRPVLLPLGVALAVFTVAVLPGRFSLDAVPVLNLLNLKRLDWPTVHLVLLTYTGVAVAGSTLAYARRTRGACIHCGRRAGRSQWSRSRWARIGRAASIAALVTPCGYAVIRLFWAAGVPVGTTAEFLAQINAANPGRDTTILELILAAMAIGGGVLCFGLTRPWSEIWPRWIPGLAGRRVPHWFPMAVAISGGIGLTGNGSTLAPGLLRALAGDQLYYDGTSTPMTWVSQLPAVSLFLWGPLVLVSICSFHYRTRSQCRRCRQR